MRGMHLIYYIPPESPQNETEILTVSFHDDIDSLCN